MLMPTVHSCIYSDACLRVGLQMGAAAERDGPYEGFVGPVPLWLEDPQSTLPATGDGRVGPFNKEGGAVDERLRSWWVGVLNLAPEGALSLLELQTQLWARRPW